VSSGNSQTRLVSFLTADSDPGQYGKLQSFVMPNGQSVLGPVQVDNAIIRTPAISTAITLLNQQGSQIIQGSMQLIPVGNSIIYVRPFYAQGRGQGSYPQFQFVAVFTQGKAAACATSVGQALDQLFTTPQPSVPCSAGLASTLAGGSGSGSSSSTTTTLPPVATTNPPAATTVPPSTGSVQDLLNQAAAKLDQAQTALTQGNLGEYQSLVNEAKQLVKQAQANAAK
jgi:hypothetical protein